MTYEASKDKLIKDAQALQDDAIDRAVGTMDSVQREAAAVKKVVQKSATEIANEVTKKLREAGVDTDQLMITAREQAGDLQKRITDEIRDRPLRALGFAALAGVVFGLMSAR